MTPEGELFHAVKRGNYNGVDAALESGVDYKLLRMDGKSILGTSLSWYKFKVVRGNTANRPWVNMSAYSAVKPILPYTTDQRENVSVSDFDTQDTYFAKMVVTLVTDGWDETKALKFTET